MEKNRENSEDNEMENITKNNVRDFAFETDGEKGKDEIDLILIPFHTSKREGTKQFIKERLNDIGFSVVRLQNKEYIKLIKRIDDLSIFNELRKG